MDEASAALKAVREKIIEALAEYDFIAFQENPRILSDYNVKIEAWRLKLLTSQLKALRAKAKYEYLQAMVNAGETLDELACEKHLDKEFEAWQEDLANGQLSYEKSVAIREFTYTLSPEEQNELKKIHRILIKRLHPDLRDINDENQNFLLLMAQKAYERGDLDAFRSLEISTRQYEKQDEALNTLEEINAALVVEEAQLQLIFEKLDELKESEPYIFKDLLADDDWVQTQISSYKKEIRDSEENYDLYQNRIVQILED